MNAMTKTFAAITMAIISGCASGPKYAEIQKSIPTISGENGRILFYRSGNVFGSGIQPNVQLNGQVIGDSKPGGFFFVDKAPGNYEVILSTEIEKKLTFTLEKMQRQCVRMTVGLGVIVYRVYPELVDPGVCENEIQDLSYTGTPVKQ